MSIWKNHKNVWFVMLIAMLLKLLLMCCCCWEISGLSFDPATGRVNGIVVNIGDQFDPISCQEILQNIKVQKCFKVFIFKFKIKWKLYNMHEHMKSVQSLFSRYTNTWRLVKAFSVPATKNIFFFGLPIIRELGDMYLVHIWKIYSHHSN